MFHRKSAAQFFSNVHVNFVFRSRSAVQFFLYLSILVRFISILCFVMFSFLYLQILLMLFKCLLCILICECIWLFFFFGDDRHMTSMIIVKFSRPPTSLVYLHSKFFHPLDLRCPISNNLPNQPPPHPRSPFLLKNIIQGWLFMLPGPSFRLAFIFSINSLVLPGLSFDLILFS